MKRSDFHYDLPPELIAQEARPRGRSRMLVLTPGEGEPGIRHANFSEFPTLLNSGDVLVINDTLVFPARLFAEPKGAMKRPIEVLLTRRLGALRWQSLCKPGRRVKRGDRLVFSEKLTASVEARSDDGTFDLLFSLPAVPRSRDPEDLFWTELDRIGSAPVPPYIRSDRPRDVVRSEYQTVYATKRGAVAAPTAGLHFSDEILREIEEKEVEIVRITLHVGLGTFRPVEVQDVRDHRMDYETWEISAAAASSLNRATAAGRRMVAVGTTSVRTLESAIRRGGGKFEAGSAETDLFITPGFEFHVVDALLTNFHLPESTLLMLVSAFAGMETIRKAYREAIEEKYLFYSFGDCMFVGRWAPDSGHRATAD